MSFSSPSFTLLHVVLSILGVVAGLVMVGGLMCGRRLDGWTGAFLVTTVLTNVTGFLFPFTTFLPSHGVGIVSLVILPVVLAALYWKRLNGVWKTVFVVGSVTALYLNVFVLMVQLFRRVPAMLVSAPKQNEPPFVVTQLLVLVVFLWLGRAARKGFAEAGLGEAPALGASARTAIAN